MDYSYILEKYSIDEHRLISFGFEQTGDRFELEHTLDTLGLSVRLTLDKVSFVAEVFDVETGDKYAPFDVASATGAFVGKVREQVESLIDRVVLNCFENESLREWVIGYAEQKADSFVERPWTKNQNYVTLKRGNGKWYGLVADIPQRYLFGESDRIVDVMNIKLPPEKIDSLIDNKTFFRAWHMNKKFWITIVLDRKISQPELKALIDESYGMVGNKRK